MIHLPAMKSQSFGHLKTSGNRWCPFCPNPPKKLCENKECKSCEQKSFASHPMVRLWSPKNRVGPRQVFLKSNLQYKFDCDKCGHSFENIPNNFAKMMNVNRAR